jgi:hypothetical protein
MASFGKLWKSSSKILKIKSDKTLDGPNVGSAPVWFGGDRLKDILGLFYY